MSNLSKDIRYGEFRDYLKSDADYAKPEVDRSRYNFMTDEIHNAVQNASLEELEQIYEMVGRRLEAERSGTGGDFNSIAPSRYTPGPRDRF